MPIVLGHEGTGVVVEVGQGVSGLQPGDRVVMTLVPACGNCYFCRRGEPHLCSTSGAMAARGVLRDGSSRLRVGNQTLHHFNSVSCFSEYAVIPQEGAVKIPNDIPVEVAAVLGCAVITLSGRCADDSQSYPGRTNADRWHGEPQRAAGRAGIGVQQIEKRRWSANCPAILIQNSSGTLMSPDWSIHEVGWAFAT
jgi:S-(hydroxymethyl)glutathione dehydrogenase / alcohol dehydrogenase